MRGQFYTGGDMGDQVTLDYLVTWDTHVGDGDGDGQSSIVNGDWSMVNGDYCLVSWGTHGQAPADLTTALNWGPAKA